MEKQIVYKVYRIYRGIRELIGTYQEAGDAHEVAQRYNTPHTIIQIEKVSQLREKV